MAATGPDCEDKTRRRAVGVAHRPWAPRTRRSSRERGGGPDAGARAARARLEARGRRHGSTELCRDAPFGFEVTSRVVDPSQSGAWRSRSASVSLACWAKVEKEEGHLGDKVGSQSPPVHTRGGAGLARREQSGSSEGRCRRYRPTSPRRRRAATPSITPGSATVRPVPRAPCVRRSRRLRKYLRAPIPNRT